MGSKAKGKCAFYGSIFLGSTSNVASSLSSTQINVPSMGSASSSSKRKLMLFDPSGSGLSSGPNKKAKSKSPATQAIGEIHGTLVDIREALFDLKPHKTRPPSLPPPPPPASILPPSPAIPLHSAAEEAVARFQKFFQRAKEHNDHWLTEVQAFHMVRMFQNDEKVARFFLSVIDDSDLGVDEGVMCLWVGDQLGLVQL